MKIVLRCDCDRRLQTIEKGVKDIMSLVEDQFNQLLNRMDEATNLVADELRNLREIVKDSGMSASKEQEVVQKLTSSIAKLEGVGKKEDAPPPAGEVPPQGPEPGGAPAAGNNQQTPPDATSV